MAIPAVDQLRALLSPRIFALVLTALFPISTTIVFITGLWVVGRAILRVLRVILNITILPGTKLSVYGAETGAWAAITGATDGLGREFALQLAAKGFNILLLGRNPEKLASVLKEIELATPQIKVKTFQIDFSVAGDAEYERLESSLRGLDLGILVNNAGQAHTLPAPFIDCSPSEASAIIATNVNGTVRTTAAALPAMRARQGRSLLLCIGSLGGGLVPMARLATYTATKAFLQTWAEALAEELRTTRIDVVVQHAGFIANPRTMVKKVELGTPDSQTYVRVALKSLGNAGGLSRPCASTPYWSHAIVACIVETFGLGWAMQRASTKTLEAKYAELSKMQ